MEEGGKTGQEGPSGRGEDNQKGAKARVRDSDR